MWAQRVVSGVIWHAIIMLTHASTVDLEIKAKVAHFKAHYKGPLVEDSNAINLLQNVIYD